MTKAEAALLHASHVLVGGTGLVYAWMLWFATSDDPDALVNHPLQPDVQHLHVLTAPLLVFALGLVWRAHVWARVRNGHRARRTSGLVLFASSAPMIASGYFVQTAVDPTWREAWVAVHVATSLAWIAAYALHQSTRILRSGAIQDERGLDR